MAIAVQSKVEKKCFVCGYAKHTQVCHIKPVADFDKDAKLQEINAITNLLRLCPTHHWELDHNCLESNIFAGV